MAELDFIDIGEVRAHYDKRSSISKELRGLLQEGAAGNFCRLALGISDADGNYSASDHGLGPQILAAGKPEAVLNLARKLAECEAPRDMVKTIYAAQIRYLKIGVGSEVAMMVRPDTFWVANTRSIWAHLLVKHKFNYARANEELRLYRDPDAESEMDYEKWRAIYLDMEKNLRRLGSLADSLAKKMSVKPGTHRNIWNDAIANQIYEKRKWRG